MKTYVFFVGGTGARVYKSFIHCAAAGVLKLKSVSAMLVDADKTNDANTSSLSVFQQYTRVRKRLGGSAESVFNCDISMLTESIVSPVRSTASSLQDAVGNLSPDRKRMMECLYTQEEYTQELEGGFYAHPNIGCVFFADFEDSDFRKSMESIANDLDHGEKVSVVLVGSIFGGTGAAGIPTILKVIRGRFSDSSNRNNLHFGGVFLEPYFKVNEKADETSPNIPIKMEDFKFNSYQALNYYDITKLVKLESLYLIRQMKLDIVSHKYKDSGKDQNNKPHIMEVYAALAIDELCNKHKEGVFVVDREENLSWENFCEQEDSMMLKMADFMRAQAVFAYKIYEYSFTPENLNKKFLINVPQWYKAYSVYKTDQLNILEEFEEYSRSFVEWIYMWNSMMNEKGKISLNSDMRLFGEGLQDIYDAYITLYINTGKLENDQNSKTTKRQCLRNIKDTFNTLIDTTSNVEYAIEKISKIISFLGVVTRSEPQMGVISLFLRIMSLVSNKNT